MTAPLLDIQRPSAFVARVFLNRPELRNAFNPALVLELTQAFTAFADDGALRVIVLGGHGKTFCAGADLNWMRESAGHDWERNRRDAEALAEMLAVLDRCPVPMVARLHADCIAGGMGLAAVCDVRVAAHDAGFCLSEARIGLVPATIGPYVIRAMGESAARRYFVTAERFDARRAQAIGFVHEVCEAGALDATVDSIVEAIVANGPRAAQACKQLVRDLAGQPITAALRAETARRIADIRASDEGREGLQSFLDKRPPAWRDSLPGQPVSDTP